ncbi:hypothetical protein B0A49_03347 [Cryomyces minteri]|uniref:Uncharacterized protein n=1 Tax=Cryomyces minteri TaxID=331657 RepID=A0A4U0XUH2_9PEZI|nr:hypothetical protein B0A49_03347 [Cryomyces minteri]
MESFIRNVSSRFSSPGQSPGQSPRHSIAHLPLASSNTDAFITAPKGKLFPQTDPAIDGEDCLHDCASCTIKYPPKFETDEEDELYGHVKGFSTHLIVATGKTDWVRDVRDEKGSVMEAVGRAAPEGNLKNGVSDILSHLTMALKPRYEGTPSQSGTADSFLDFDAIRDKHENSEGADTSTTCLLLPAFTLIDDVTPSLVPDLISSIIERAPTSTTPLHHKPSATDTIAAEDPFSTSSAAAEDAVTSSQPSTTRTEATPMASADPFSVPSSIPTPRTSPPPPSHQLHTRPSPHKYLILLCSQRTRDARCGQSAPLLRRELERHLRPLGLYRDLHDERPGGCGIYFISHVGGHKYSANMFVYRRDEAVGEAAQCIWLARVRPEDCENIVRFTILKGKVVKPDRQLRGGFDRERLVTSW